MREPAVQASGAAPDRERGSGTVLVAAGTAAVLMVLVGALLLSAVVRATHLAASAADLAALAGARTLVTGESLSVACARAEQIATANSARLSACHAGPQGSLLVTAIVPVVGTSWTASRVSRAGPVSDR